MDYLIKGGGLPKNEMRKNEEGVSDTKREGRSLKSIKIVINIKPTVAVNKYSACGF